MRSNYFHLKRVSHECVLSLFESIKIIKKLHHLSAAIRDVPVDSGNFQKKYFHPQKLRFLYIGLFKNLRKIIPPQVNSIAPPTPTPEPTGVSVVSECQNVLQQIIQNAFDGKIEKYHKCQNACDHSFPDELFPFKMLVLSVKVSLMIIVTFIEQSM